MTKYSFPALAHDSSSTNLFVIKTIIRWTVLQQNVIFQKYDLNRKTSDLLKSQTIAYLFCSTISDEEIQFSGKGA